MFDDHADQVCAIKANGPGDVQSESFETAGSLCREKRISSLKSGYPLAMAKDKEILTITSMHGGRSYRRQLMDMGLRPGMQITVIRAGGGGPVLISVGETRLGIGRGMAEKIEVVPGSEAISS